MSASAMERNGFDVKADLYVAAVVVAGAGVLGSSVRHIAARGLEFEDLACLGIALLVVLIGRLSVRLPFPGCRVSFSDALIFLSVLIFGGDFATLTAAVDGFAASPRQKGTLHKTVFNMAGMAVSVRISAGLFSLLRPNPASGHGFSPLDLLLPVTTLALSQYVLNTLLVSTAMALKDHASFLSTWRSASPWAGIACLIGSLAAAAVFVVVRDLGVVLAFAVLPFPIVLHLAFRACLSHRVFQRSAVPVRSDRS